MFKLIIRSVSIHGLVYPYYALKIKYFFRKNLPKGQSSQLFPRFDKNRGFQLPDITHLVIAETYGVITKSAKNGLFINA